MIERIKSIGKKEKYYSLDNILKTNSTYNIIIGERSNGKTYACLKYALEQYFKNGGQFGIIRRWQEDIRGKRASSIWAGLIANNEIEKVSQGKYTGIHYFSGRFYLCNYDDNGKAIYNDNDLIGYTFALTDMEHNKSISYPYITTLIFDEFLTRGIYLPDEFVIFMNTISTVVRNRANVKIFMLGNTVNKYSPYFKEMGLNHITKMKQGTIDVYTYGNSNLRVAVEYCAHSGVTKENDYYFAFDNPKLQMITTGAWELDIYPHLPVKYKPKDVLLEYFIKFDGQIYQCNIVEVDGNMFTYIHEKTTPIKDDDNDIIYSLEYSHKMNYNRSIYRPKNQLQRRILYFFEHDLVYYQDNQVGDAINNYLKIARGL